MAHTATTTRPSSAMASLHDQSAMSVISLQPTALEICNCVYGESDESSSLDTLSRFYEASASDYENPLVTATSRSVIADIFNLSRRLSTVSIPRPLATLYALFRLPSLYIRDTGNYSVFQALRAWTDIGDICETESFDGHRKCIVEHTLNVLFLPGLHLDGTGDLSSFPSSDSLMSNYSPYPESRVHNVTAPSLPIPGTLLSLPSPFHFRLHIITRLSFNEQGRITHHRDYWDLKDVMALVPGVSIMQWVGTRLAAKGLTYIARLFDYSHRSEGRSEYSSDDILEKTKRVFAPAASYGVPVQNALGLEGI